MMKTSRLWSLFTSALHGRHGVWTDGFPNFHHGSTETELGMVEVFSKNRCFLILFVLDVGPTKQKRPTKSSTTFLKHWWLMTPPFASILPPAAQVSHVWDPHRKRDLVMNPSKTSTANWVSGRWGGPFIEQLQLQRGCRGDGKKERNPFHVGTAFWLYFFYILRLSWFDIDWMCTWIYVYTHLLAFAILTFEVLNEVHPRKWTAGTQKVGGV